MNLQFLRIKTNLKHLKSKVFILSQKCVLSTLKESASGLTASHQFVVLHCHWRIICCWWIHCALRLIWWLIWRGLSSIWLRVLRIHWLSLLGGIYLLLLLGGNNCCIPCSGRLCYYNTSMSRTPPR